LLKIFIFAGLIVVSMNNAVTLVTGIEYKVRRLTGKCGILKAENQRLTEEVNALKNRIETLEASLNELQEKLTVLKLAKSLNREESRTNVKLKINELVREIDHCIGLLNK
jgi:chromosome segregation ATPase